MNIVDSYCARKMKKALLVGVKYSGKKYLPGLGKDLENMEATLKSRGFLVTVLNNFQNQEEISEKILSCYAEISQSLTAKDDIFVFYFTGHGYHDKNTFIEVSDTRICSHEW